MFSILGAAAIAAMSANELPPEEPSTASTPPHIELEASAYAESGSEYFGSNEVPDIYREHAVGLGLLGSVRFGRDSGAAIPTGPVLLLGLTNEWRALENTFCGYGCAGPFAFRGGVYAGASVGAGYDATWIGFRAGALTMGGSAVGAHTLFFPDVALRVGPLDFGYLTFGLGEYDAPTMLRPGLYVGASAVIAQRLTLALHYGAHFDHGTFGDTVFQLDSRLDFSLAYRFTHALSGSVGVVDQASPEDNHVYEAHCALRVRLGD